MNHFIISVLVIAMCLGLNESKSGCFPNTVEFKNQLGPGSVLKVNCTSNTNENKGIRDVKFNEKYQISFNEAGKERIVWRCHLRQGDGNHFIDIWRAYRGASRKRCNQIRAYIVKSDAVRLVRNNEPTKQSFVWMLARF
ncbi:hypothetical protein YC2023_021800 [Brassica napus]